MVGPDGACGPANGEEEGAAADGASAGSCICPPQEAQLTTCPARSSGKVTTALQLGHWTCKFPSLLEP